MCVHFAELFPLPWYYQYSNALGLVVSNGLTLYLISCMYACKDMDAANM